MSGRVRGADGGASSSRMSAHDAAEECRTRELGSLEGKEKASHEKAIAAAGRVSNIVTMTVIT